MKKYEIYSDSFETRLSGRSEEAGVTLTEKDIYDLYGMETFHDSSLLESYDSKEAALADFHAHYRKYATTTLESGASYNFLAATVVYVEENEYDEDGEYDSGHILEYAAEPFGEKEEDQR